MFTDKTGNPKRLIGCAIASGSVRIAELAARIGFDAIWIEMEHTAFHLASAEAACIAVEAAGALSVVRTEGTRREHILHALEIGGRIIVVPLVNDAETARELVKHGKYRPLGQRGYNTRSRAVSFGLNADMFARANAETILLPQIETIEAVRNVDAILDVEGLGGIFVGPGGLSADLGRPGKFDDPELRGVVVQCISKARQRGLHAGILVGEGSLLDAAMEAGADLCVLASDMKPLIDAWKAQLGRYRLT